LKNFPELDDSLRAPVEEWLENQQIPELVVDGVSIHDVIEKRRSHFLKAIRDLNRLLDPNLTPEQHDNWKRIITTPRFYE
jgi:phage regulator Rha-like protein